MRRMKSLLFAACVLALGAGTALAGQDSTVQGSVETSPPELLMEDELALEEGDVIYIYPIEVAEYYLLIPSESSNMPG